jgi:hypothetical protein
MLLSRIYEASAHKFNRYTLLNTILQRICCSVEITSQARSNSIVTYLSYGGSFDARKFASEINRGKQWLLVVVVESRSFTQNHAGVGKDCLNRG